MFTGELWMKLKTIMLKMGVYDKPFLRHTIEGIFIDCGAVAHGEICQMLLLIEMQFISDLMNGSAKEKLLNIFNKLVVELGLEWEFIDESIVKAHQHSSGAGHGQ